jgi:hypothetical protein
MKFLELQELLANTFNVAPRHYTAVYVKRQKWLCIYRNSNSGTTITTAAAVTKTLDCTAA